METIFALASAQGRAGVSVVRLSGPCAFRVANQLCGSLPTARETAVKLLKDQSGQVLDQALILVFEGPASFTGEDTVEFQVHGSVAVVRAVLAALGKTGDARHALPGEFTRRALENNKLDLSQVEGLADLIDAETEAQRKQALRVLSGALGEKVERWRINLIRAAALLEATIDFADEDIPVDVTPEVEELLRGVQRDVVAEIKGSHTAERVRSGFEVAIVGAPNAGKSTLLNRLAGRDAAITSEIAGTTRDVIEVRMDLGGVPVTFLDTAGLRESDDQIERVGVKRALSRARDADLRIFLAGPEEDLLLEPSPEDIRVTPKIDLLTSSRIGISGKTGAGVSELIRSIEKTLSTRVTDAGLATHERHRVAMETSLDGLVAAQKVLERGPENYDIASEELRAAIRALEALVGRIDVESLLDEIFSSFCLGK